MVIRRPSAVHGDSPPLTAQAGSGTVGTIPSSVKARTIVAIHVHVKTGILSIMTALTTIIQIATVVRTPAIAVIGGLNQKSSLFIYADLSSPISIRLPMLIFKRI